jgi:hypothetical protein
VLLVTQLRPERGEVSRNGAAMLTTLENFVNKYGDYNDTIDKLNGMALAISKCQNTLCENNQQWG